MDAPQTSWMYRESADATADAGVAAASTKIDKCCCDDDCDCENAGGVVAANSDCVCGPKCECEEEGGGGGEGEVSSKIMMMVSHVNKI